MKTIVMSLGTILKTDFNMAVAAFIGAANLSPTEAKGKLSELMPLFPQFNSGKLSKEEFKNAFLKILPLKEPEKFEEIWNSMCIVNDSVNEIVKTIVKTNQQHNDQLQVVIYSDTNPIHFDFIQSQLKDSGLDFDKMYISYQHGMFKDALLQKIIKDFNDHQFIVVLGNTDKITDESLKKMVQEKNQAVLDIAEKLTVIRLSGSQLTQEDIIGKLIKPYTNSPILTAFENVFMGFGGNYPPTASSEADYQEKLSENLRVEEKLRSNFQKK